MAATPSPLLRSSKPSSSSVITSSLLPAPIFCFTSSCFRYKAMVAANSTRMDPTINRMVLLCKSEILGLSLGREVGQCKTEGFLVGSRLGAAMTLRAMLGCVLGCELGCVVGQWDTDGISDG